jgi:hypothetical protein
VGLAAGTGVGIGAAAGGEAVDAATLIPSAAGRRDRTPWQETALALTQPASCCVVSTSSHKPLAV